ncbi:sigma-70 family RNA polymerase sigma factor [Treponema ruminis]|nr:sigma-70 family RNA polymerase sigma factor [Treponema ruminis]
MKTLTNRDFSELYQKYAPMVLRCCRSILNDEDLALAAMQKVFVQIMSDRVKKQKLSANFFYMAANRVCREICDLRLIKEG